MIPGEFTLLLNQCYSTELDYQGIIDKTEAILPKHCLDYHIEWGYSGFPFLTAEGNLVEAAQQSIKTITGIDTKLSTAGGTSDGRFIAPTGAQVLELGPVNATIHQINECVDIAELDQLSDIYQGMLERLLA